MRYDHMTRTKTSRSSGIFVKSTCKLVGFCLAWPTTPQLCLTVKLQHKLQHKCCLLCTMKFRLSADSSKPCQQTKPPIMQRKTSKRLGVWDRWLLSRQSSGARHPVRSSDSRSSACSLLTWTQSRTDRAATAATNLTTWKKKHFWSKTICFNC